MASRPPRPPDAAGAPPDDEDLGVEATEPLSLKDAAANVMGHAMLGLDQALRDGPPPQIRAAEQTPDESTVSGTSDLTIEFPDAPVEFDEEG